VIENAGGVITDWQANNSFDDAWDGCLLAAASPEITRTGA